VRRWIESRDEGTNSGLSHGCNTDRFCRRSHTGEAFRFAIYSGVEYALQITSLKGIKNFNSPHQCETDTGDGSSEKFDEGESMAKLIANLW